MNASEPSSSTTSTITSKPPEEAGAKPSIVQVPSDLNVTIAADCSGTLQTDVVKELRRLSPESEDVVMVKDPSSKDTVPT